MKKRISFNGALLLWMGLVAILSLLGACEKEEESMSDEIRTLNEISQSILGEWKWERTEIHYRGQENPRYETPDTENKTIYYVFRKNGTAIKNESGSEPTNYKFEITSPEAGAFYLKLSPIEEEAKASNSILILYRDYLILTNGLGITSYYTQNK